MDSKSYGTVRDLAVALGDFLSDSARQVEKIDRLRDALKLARLHIQDTALEHAVVSLDHLDVGLGGYIDAVISETNY